MLASVGVATVGCARRPRIAVLTTGDELLEPGDPPRPGGVRNSNAYTIPALALSAGAEVVAGSRPSGTIPNRPGTRSSGSLDSEFAVICGGVSVGEHDHVKAALASLGVEQVFWRVALKPGKPTWFGIGTGRHAGFRPAREPRLGDGHLPAFRPPRDPALLGVAPEAGRGSRPSSTRTSRAARARPRRPLLARASRRRLARPADREPGLARAHLDARRRRARDRARRRRCRRWPASRVEVELLPGVGPRIASMTVTVRLFAILRERAGSDSIEVELEDGATVADALDRLAERPELGELLGGCRCGWRSTATTRTRTPRSGRRRRAGAGPAGQRRRAATRTCTSGSPTSRSRSSRSRGSVARPGAGAIVIFQGTTRDVDPPRVRGLRRDGGGADRGDPARMRRAPRARGRGGRAPRSAPVPLGESSVIVAVSAAHRGEAFAGAREAIDRIKAEAPIWKREVEGTAAGERALGRGHGPARDGRGRRLTSSPISTTRAARGWSTSAPSRRPSAVPGAEARVRMSPETAAALERGDAPKGDVLGTAGSRGSRRPSAPAS